MRQTSGWMNWYRRGEVIIIRRSKMIRLLRFQYTVLGLLLTLAACGENHRAMPNTIYVITPYYYASTWVFDDPAVGLKAEPFVSGIPAMIDVLVAGIPNARQGFRLLFSAEPFPGYQAELKWMKGEFGGHWYRWPAHGMEGWLCPALFKYFSEAPPALYARAERFSH